MEHVKSGIVKKQLVSIGQPVRLGGVPESVSTGGGSAGARIIKQNEKYALVEITCTCGDKTHLKCDFADMP